MQAHDIFLRQLSDNRFPWPFIDILRCPADGGELVVESCDGPRGEAIRRGSLACQSCHRSFPIIDGILRLLHVDQLDEEALHEIKYRDDAGQHSQKEIQSFETSLRSRLEIRQHVRALNLNSNSVVLELACGRGKFTIQLLKTCRVLLGVDFSLASLETLARRLAPETQVGLVHADITQLKFKRESFDRAFSTTPLDSREQRMTMHRITSEAVTDDSVYVFSVEYYGWRTRLLGNPRLTRYPNEGSVFQRMTREEAEGEAAPYFSRVKSRPIQIFIPVVKSVRLGRLAERIPLLRNFGDLLLVRASRPIRTPPLNQRTQGSRLFKSLCKWLKLPDTY